MTQPTPTPGTRVEIRPGAASAWGRKFPIGGKATVLETAVPEYAVGEVYVLPDGDPKHHQLCLPVSDLIPIGHDSAELPEPSAIRGEATPPVTLTPYIEHATRAFYAEAGVPFDAMSRYDQEQARRCQRAAITAVTDRLAIANPFANHYPAARDAGDARYGSGKDGCSCGDKLMGGRAAHLMAVLRTAMLGEPRP